MAKVECKISVNTDQVRDFTKRIEAMAAFFEAAPDTDPVKIEMARFGEIDMAKHLETKTDFADGQVVVSVAPSPDFQRIMDMVPS